MSSELVERLEVAAQWDDSPSELIHEAIARIEASESENERLREVLEPFAKEAKLWAGYDDDEILCEGFPNGPASTINVGHLRAARRAREGVNNG